MPVEQFLSEFGNVRDGAILKLWTVTKPDGGILFMSALVDDNGRKETEIARAYDWRETVEASLEDLTRQVNRALAGKY